MRETPPEYDVDPRQETLGRLGIDEVRTIPRAIATRFSNWDTIVADLEIAAASLGDFFPARQAYLEPGHLAWRHEHENRRELVRLWTTAVTFFFRCYSANGKRRQHLTRDDFPSFNHYNAIRLVKAHRDKAIHHSVNAADASVAGVGFRGGEVVAVLTASNRRFFPDPAVPHAEVFKEVVDRGLELARTHLQWAEWDLHEHAKELTAEQRAALPDGMRLQDPALGWGYLPRKDDESEAGEDLRPKSGRLNPIRMFRSPGFMAHTKFEAFAVGVDPAAGTAVIELRTGETNTVACKACALPDLVIALEGEPRVRVACERQLSGGSERLRVTALVP